jgi:hypothetical protein
MSNETSARSGGEADRSRSHGRDSGQQSPLQARAQFLKNWDWDTVIRLNRGACERGKAQHGPNPETQAKIAEDWEARRRQELSFTELIDFLRYSHHSAPFLFFNGNTFADIGRQTAAALFAELPTSRRREAASAVAHYIAGVLDRDPMISIVETLCQSADLKPGDRVKTFRGASQGTITHLRDDGRVVWRSDASATELIALPESPSGHHLSRAKNETWEKKTSNSDDE